MRSAKYHRLSSPPNSITSRSRNIRVISDGILGKIWEKNMTEESISHRAPSAGALALLSFVATVSPGQGTSPTPRLRRHEPERHMRAFTSEHD